MLNQSFSLGPVVIHYYGLILAAAIISALLLSRARAKKIGLNSEQIDSTAFWLILGGFIGARIYHVFTDFWRYQDNLLDALKIWQGGLSIYGALLGGFIAFILLRKFKPEIKNIPLLILLDFTVPAVALAQSIGRWGNYVNYEAFGLPTNLPWKMYVPGNFRPLNYNNFEYFHPTFLYESLWNLALFVFLLFLAKKKLPIGTLFFTYLLMYNSARFFLEFLRLDSVFIDGIRFNALVSLTLIVIALLVLLIITLRAKGWHKSGGHQWARSASEHPVGVTDDRTP